MTINIEKDGITKDYQVANVGDLNKIVKDFPSLYFICKAPKSIKVIIEDIDSFLTNKGYEVVLVHDPEDHVSCMDSEEALDLQMEHELNKRDSNGKKE